MMVYTISNLMGQSPLLLSNKPDEIKKNYIVYMAPLMNLKFSGENINAMHGLFHMRHWNQSLTTRTNLNHLLVGNEGQKVGKMWFNAELLGTYNFLSFDKKVSDDLYIKVESDGTTKTSTLLLYDGIVRKKLGVNLGAAYNYAYVSENGIGLEPFYQENIAFNRSLINMRTTMGIVGLSYSRFIYASALHQGYERDKNLNWRVYFDLLPFLNGQKAKGDVKVTIPGYADDGDYEPTTELHKFWTNEELDIQTVNMGYRFGWERIYAGFGSGMVIKFGLEFAKSNMLNSKDLGFRTKLGIGF